MEIRFSNKRLERILQTSGGTLLFITIISVLQGKPETLFNFTDVPLLFAFLVGFIYLKRVKVGIKILTFEENTLKIEFYSRAKKIMHLKQGSFYVKIKEKTIDFFDITTHNKIAHASYIELEEKNQWEKMEELLKPIQNINPR